MTDKKHSDIHTKFMAALDGSFFLRLLTVIADWFYNCFGRSFTSWLLSSNTEFSKAKQGSFFHRIFFSLPQTAVSNIKLYFAKQFEESSLLHMCSKAGSKAMNCSLRSFGAGLAAYGIISLIIGLTSLSGKFEEIFALKFIIIVLLIITGLILLVSRTTVAEGILGSSFMKGFFVNVAGIREGWFAAFDKPTDSFFTTILIGTLLGLATFKLPVFIIPAAVLAVVGAVTLLSSPEFGVILALFMLPFLPTLVLAALSIAVFISFMLKYIRGKRVIRFDSVMFFTSMFVILLIFEGLNSPARMSSLKTVAIYLAFLSLSFVIANTFKTHELTVKAVTALLTSATISALVGVYQKVVGVEKSLIWVDKEMFSDISTRVFGTFDNPNVFGEFLVALMPLALAVFFVRKGMLKLTGGAVFMLMGISLIFTYSRGSWLALIASLAIFLCCYHKNFFKLGLVGVAAIPFLPALLPASIVNRFMSIGNMADTSTTYRVSIWRGAVSMMKAFWPTGSGIGSDSFTIYYPAFALSGAQYALHSHNLYFQIVIELGALGALCFVLLLFFNMKNVFSCFSNSSDNFNKLMILALGTGLFAILIQGLTDNVWYNFRIFLLFWILIGLTSGMFKGYEESAEKVI